MRAYTRHAAWHAGNICHMCRSDMKLDVVMVAIVSILGLHIYVPVPGHGFEH